MSTVRILTKSAESGSRLKAALEKRGFSATFVIVDASYYDAIIADNGIINENSPVVLFTKQESVRQVITEAVVAEKFKPLNDQLGECLELCKKG